MRELRRESCNKQRDCASWKGELVRLDVSFWAKAQRDVWDFFMERELRKHEKNYMLCIMEVVG